MQLEIVFMMGRQDAPEQLFYNFRLEDHVPTNHLLRQLDRVLRFDRIRSTLASHYSHTGRPSIDPELMLRILLIGYAYGIRSERRLCEEVHLNLAYRWFCRLGLDGSVPDHSTFSKNRYGRFQESGIYRTLFEDVVRQCQASGLVGGEGFAVDGTLLAADASRDTAVPSVEALRSRIDPNAVSRPVKAWLEALDVALPPEETTVKRSPPVTVSATDPQAAWSNKEGLGRFGYFSNYLIDTQHAVIVDVEATPARLSQEIAAARGMIERAEENHGLKPQRLAADKSYGTGPFLSWLLDREVEPHIPVLDRQGQTDGMFTRDAFAYDAEKNQFTCPQGRVLTLAGLSNAGQVYHYRPPGRDCSGCPLKKQCTAGKYRTVSRHVQEDARDRARALQGTDAYERSRRERKKVEMLFAHLKRHMGFRRLKLRGLDGATEECLMAATVQNLKRLVRLRPPDMGKICLPAAA
jgi:transposase